MSPKAKEITKFAIAFWVSTYLLIGAYFGFGLKTVMPAVNYYGAVYVALTWPTWLKGSPIELPIADWMFTFKE